LKGDGIEVRERRGKGKGREGEEGQGRKEEGRNCHGPDQDCEEIDSYGRVADVCSQNFLVSKK